MRRWNLSAIAVLLTLLAGGCAWAAGDEPNAANRALSFIPWVRLNPCSPGYRQLAFSPPLKRVSEGDKGHPWRALYGYCVARDGRLALHQDWVLSYLHARPWGDSPGGDGIGLGTEFSLLWRQRNGNRWTPYYEGGLGIQYAAGTAFPANGGRWMFTINAGAGLLMPLRSGREINTAIRYLHISNAGFLSENAGYDAFHLLVGFRW